MSCSMEQKLLEDLINMHMLALKSTSEFEEILNHNNQIQRYQQRYERVTGKRYSPLVSTESDSSKLRVGRASDAEDVFLPSQPMDSLFMVKRPYDVYQEVRYNEGVNL